MGKAKLLALAGIVVAVAAFFALGGHRYLGFDYLKSQQAAIDQWYASNPRQVALGFFAAYVAVTALSLPGATILTLAAGAVFGLGWGTVLVSFASTVGATLAFLASRLLLRDWVQKRFGRQLRSINEGVAKEGAMYLFTLRLIPVVPFFVINLAMGLTSLRTWTYAWVSQLGMLAGTLVYVNAGTQLAQLQSVSGILSPGLVGAFVLLGVFPLVASRVLAFGRARKAYAGWEKPPRFDRNMVVIGAGSGGLVAALIAAVVKAKVTLVEKHQMGGDCLNTGCVPSKALIKTARVLAQMRRAKEYGLRSATAEFDFAEVMERVQRVVKEVEPHDSVERFTQMGVECMAGEAKIVSPWAVEVTGADGAKRTLTTRSIVIAAGAAPFVPPIPGLAEAGFLTSDTLWGLRELPARLVVLGGGPIGCELAQAFARFGSRVTQVEMLPRLMAREDPEVSALVEARFRAEGVEVLTGHKAQRFLSEGGRKVLVCEGGAGEVRIEFDAVLVALGRAPCTTGYGLEELGIPVSPAKTIETNEFLQTLYPNIYACGDVAGPYQFTHVASHQAWYASVNALFGVFRRFRADYSVIPWATFTDPEVARVGLSETEAKEKGVPHEVSTYGIDDLDRAIADGEAHGFVKVLTAPGSDRILGATIVGEHAGDVVAEFVIAMRHGLGLNKVLGTIHIYPTMAEANKYAAGVWKKAHAPQGLLRWVEKYHAWRRG